MDEEKTLKDEYKKYFKELRRYICLGLNGIVVLFPMLLFLVHLYQLGDVNPDTLDTILAIVTNVLWAPFPLWFYFKKEHGYTATEYIVDPIDKVCRFCGKRYPDVKFKKKAHAISEFIGNKEFVLRNECDACNEKFGKLP